MSPTFAETPKPTKSTPLLGVTHSEKLWDENVRSYGDKHGVRFGTSLTAIANRLDKSGANGLGYDWDVFFDYQMFTYDNGALIFGAQLEDRGTWQGTDPNFNGFPETSIFVLDGNFYDHNFDLVELWLQWNFSSVELLLGRFDQGRRFAGFIYGGSFRYFFNQAFSGNSTLSLPYAQALGADLTWHINKNWYTLVGIADANAVSRKISNFNGNIFIYAELTFNPDGSFYHLYYWHSDEGDRDKKKGGKPIYTNKSYGAGLSMDQRISPSLTLFSRLGWSNKTGTAPSQYQVSFGGVYELDNCIALGVGLSWNKATELALFDKLPVIYDEQTTAEVFVKLNITEKINASVGYTYIRHPFYIDRDYEQVYSARFQIWY